MVDPKGFEPLTSSMPWRRSSQLSYGPLYRAFPRGGAGGTNGGESGIRTHGEVLPPHPLSKRAHSTTLPSLRERALSSGAGKLYRFSSDFQDEIPKKFRRAVCAARADDRTNGQRDGTRTRNPKTPSLVRYQLRHSLMPYGRLPPEGRSYAVSLFFLRWWR